MIRMIFPIFTMVATVLFIKLYRLDQEREADVVLGHRVSTLVVNFLKRHGAVVNGRHIIGGPIARRMNTNEAIVCTVDMLLKGCALK
jgi:hypothetical protein